MVYSNKGGAFVKQIDKRDKHPNNRWIDMDFRGAIMKLLTTIIYVFLVLYLVNLLEIEKDWLYLVTVGSIVVFGVLFIVHLFDKNKSSKQLVVHKFDHFFLRMLI